MIEIKKCFSDVYSSKSFEVIELEGEKYNI